MNDEPNKQNDGLNAYGLVAMLSGGAFVASMCFALLILHQISDAGRWAGAAIAAAPAATGIGVAYCMSKRSTPA